MINIQKHRLVMIKILKDIYSDFQLSSLMGFKGGTALYLFYELPRFSVDLDFNLLDISKKKLVHQRVTNILKKHGKLKDDFIKRNTIFFLLSYGEDDQSIKVEISLHRYSNEYEIKQYLGLPVLVMKKEYLSAHKLVALTERKGVANRDIFDIWFIFKSGWGIKDEIIKLRTGLNIIEYLQKCIQFLNSANLQSILQGMGEILQPKLKTWVKRNLVSETVFFLRYYIKEIKQRD